MSASVRESLWELAEPVVNSAGYELIELEYLRESRWVVRLYIERPDVEIVDGLGVAPGAGVGLDECAQVSRELSALLDVEDVVPHNFALEVSSPGARRPLRKIEDFRRFLGCQVRVRTQDKILATIPEGQYPSRNMFGALHEVTDEDIEVIVDKRHYRVSFEQITKAHLEPDMEQWMSLAKSHPDKGESRGKRS